MAWLRSRQYHWHEKVSRHFILHRKPEDYFRWRWPVRKPYERRHLRLYSLGGGLGDELMCTPVLREIRRRNPECHLTFISRFTELFRDHPALDAVEPFEKKALLGATYLTYGSALPPPRPLVTMLGECVGFSFFDDQLDPPTVRPSEEIQRRLGAIAGPRVIIQPLASRWTPNKVWPKELWHALVTELLRDFQVIEVGTEALFSADDFGAGFHAWSGTTSLADFVWTVGQGTVFVGPPSGGMHLANAFQVPSVILYGGYESPLGHQYPRTRALYRQVPCAPCWLRENCPYDLKCLRMISTADVLTAVKELVAERQAHPLPALPPQGRPRLAVARRARSRNLREKTRELLEACARPMYAGVGSIVVLHRIVPREECSGQPSNRALEITVEDLRAILEWVRQTGLEPVSLDAVPERLAKPRRDKFITLTLDDGYRDNLLHAVPLFREYDVPFTVNLASGFMARTASAWWHALEQMLLARAAVEFSWKGEDYRMASDSPWARESAFGKLAGMIRAQGLKQREELLAVLAAATGHDPLDDTSKLMMTWDEARQLAAEPLATIGAHTVGHYSLNMLSDAEVRKEMLDSKTEIEAQLGREVRHFAYPFGGRSAVNEREFQIARECGFKTMLTTRIANLFPEHGRSLDRLPRLVVSGNYPAVSNLSVQESGLASAWQWKFRRLVTT